jgi:4,5-dihydroxyphthalate decarboxylase
MNRRKALSIIAQSSAAASTLGFSQQSLAADKPNPSKKLSISMTGYIFDRIEALANGQVKVEGCNLNYSEDRIGKMNTHLFSGPGTRDATEIGLHPFMIAYANDQFRDYSLLPVFPLRVFRHKSIFIRNDRGITKPEDLIGKKIATPGYSSSSLTWVRGILEHEYGVKPTDVEWYVSKVDSAAAITGKPSKQESIIPENITVHQGPAGKDESDMLADGDVDALFHAAEPQCYLDGHPKVSRLFNDFRSVEQAYYKKSGIFPIMHAVAMRNKTIDANPWLPEALFNAYSQSKKIAYQKINKTSWTHNSLPWVAQEIDNTKALMGKNFWPYGIEPNRKSLEALFQYSYEQGLAKKQLTIEELFHPSTLKFLES